MKFLIAFFSSIFVAHSGISQYLESSKSFQPTHLSCNEFSTLDSLQIDKIHFTNTDSTILIYDEDETAMFLAWQEKGNWIEALISEGMYYAMYGESELDSVNFHHLNAKGEKEIIIFHRYESGGTSGRSVEKSMTIIDFETRMCLCSFQSYNHEFSWATSKRYVQYLNPETNAIIEDSDAGTNSTKWNYSVDIHDGKMEIKYYWKIIDNDWHEVDRSFDRGPEDGEGGIEHYASHSKAEFEISFLPEEGDPVQGTYVFEKGQFRLTEVWVENRNLWSEN